MKKPTLGVIVGNRDFFPKHLCDSGRKQILNALAEEGINAVALSPADTSYGSVETLSDAEKCAALFKQHRDEITGVLVTLPNFGDERGVANTLRFAGLDVPVLVHAFPDVIGKMGIKDRRDSFCGKMSVCDNLLQYGIPHSLTRLHTVDPDAKSFREDLRWFSSVCQVVAGLRGARIGAIGARPAAFKTVRYSERLLERSGISVDTIDLWEVLNKANRMGDNDAAVKAKLEEIKAYANTAAVPPEKLVKMAKFGVFVQNWMAENKLVATAVQCWDAIEYFYGVTPCTMMSMMSNALLPSACEVDVAGAVGMLALTLASGMPAALVDWNNNYGDDPDKCVFFHCSNYPKQVFSDIPVMHVSDILAETTGKDVAYGTVIGRIKAEPFTYCRVSTDDYYGNIRAYVGQGNFTNDPIDTFGGYGVAQIPNLQGLLRHICEYGYEHHVAMSLSQSASAIDEAFSKYLGWDVYNHDDEGVA